MIYIKQNSSLFFGEIIDNPSKYLTSYDLKKVLNPLVESYKEVCHQIAAISRQILTPIIDNLEEMSKFIIDSMVCVLNEFANSISDFLLNLPKISTNMHTKYISNKFCSAYEQLMQTLDFPIVQPKITKQQLSNRLEQLNEAEMFKAKAAVSNMVEASPISTSKKLKLKSELYQIGKEIVIGTVSGVLASFIFGLVGCNNNIQNDIPQPTVVYNYYNYDIDSNAFNYNRVYNYEIQYHNDTN